jgi:hypothetical protein
LRRDRNHTGWNNSLEEKDIRNRKKAKRLEKSLGGKDIGRR